MLAKLKLVFLFLFLLLLVATLQGWFTPAFVAQLLSKPLTVLVWGDAHQEVPAVLSFLGFPPGRSNICHKQLESTSPPRQHLGE